MANKNRKDSARSGPDATEWTKFLRNNYETITKIRRKFVRKFPKFTAFFNPNIWICHFGFVRVPVDSFVYPNKLRKFDGNSFVSPNFAVRFDPNIWICNFGFVRKPVDSAVYLRKIRKFDGNSFVNPNFAVRFDPNIWICNFGFVRKPVDSAVYPTKLRKFDGNSLPQMDWNFIMLLSPGYISSLPFGVVYV